jgi:hypothetical protein
MSATGAQRNSQFLVFNGRNDKGDHEFRYLSDTSIVPKEVPRNSTHLHYRYYEVYNPCFPTGIIFNTEAGEIYYNTYKHVPIPRGRTFTQKQVDLFRGYLKWVLRVLFGGNTSQFAWYMNAKAAKFQRLSRHALICGGRSAVFISKYRWIGKTFWLNHIAAAINPDAEIVEYSLNDITGEFAPNRYLRQIPISEGSALSADQEDRLKNRLTAHCISVNRKHKALAEEFHESAYDISMNHWLRFLVDCRRFIVMETIQSHDGEIMNPALQAEASKWAKVYGDKARDSDASITPHAIEMMQALLATISVNLDWLGVNVASTEQGQFCKEVDKSLNGFLKAVGDGHVDLSPNISVKDFYKDYAKEIDLPSLKFFRSEFLKCGAEKHGNALLYPGTHFQISLRRHTVHNQNWLFIIPLQVPNKAHICSEEEAWNRSRANLPDSRVWVALNQLLRPEERKQRCRIITQKGKPQTAMDFEQQDESFCPSDHTEHYP